MATDDELLASVVAALLRMMPERLAVEALALPEWRELSDAERDLVYLADARMEELERRRRQEARQEAVENAARRMAEWRSH